MKQLIKGVLARLGYHVRGTRYTARQLLDARSLRSLEFADVVRRRMFDSGSEMNFIQVGAFDGVHHDPLYEYISRYRWRGVLVEPQPRFASMLQDLYRGNERVTIVEAAIDCERRTRTLFTIESGEAPGWAAGMASFDRETIARHAYVIPGIEAMIRQTTVDCVTFDDVLGRMPGEAIDLLQIDAEGADAYLLSIFPFERVKPPIVHFEVKNLTKSQQEACFDNLLDFGYRLAPSGHEDMLALLG